MEMRLVPSGVKCHAESQFFELMMSKQGNQGTLQSHGNITFCLIVVNTEISSNKDRERNLDT